jgi:AraC-like DNA-binding protein
VRDWAAAHAGVADQSHLTRQFKRTYGLTPARWAALTAASLATSRDQEAQAADVTLTR